MREIVERTLDERVRPKLAQHNGGVKLLSAEGETVRIQLLGQCANCPSSYLTTEQLILKELQEDLPEIRQVLVECSVSDELMEQARKILGLHG